MTNKTDKPIVKDTMDFFNGPATDLLDDLEEEYKNSLLIQHCRGDDKHPSRRLIFQKYLKEKYSSKLKEIQTPKHVKVTVLYI